VTAIELLNSYVSNGFLAGHESRSRREISFYRIRLASAHPSGLVTSVVLVEQRIEKFLSPAEIGSAKPSKSLSQVYDATARSEV
jgi:hypothetical protein